MTHAPETWIASTDQEVSRGTRGNCGLDAYGPSESHSASISHPVVCLPIPGGKTSSENVPEGLLQNYLPCFILGPENRLAEGALSNLLSLALDDSGSAPSNSPSEKAIRIDDAHAADALEHVLPNPLVLWGPTGCGKSHLLSGIAQLWRNSFEPTGVVELAGREIVQFLDREDWTVWSADSQKNPLRQISLLVLDDLDTIPPRLTLQSRLIHLIDTVRDAGGMILASAGKPPGLWSMHGAAVQSRFSEGLVGPIASLGPEAQKEFVFRLAKHRGLELSESEQQSLVGLRHATARILQRRMHELQLLRLAAKPQENGSQTNPNGKGRGKSKATRAKGSKSQTTDPGAPQVKTILQLTARAYSLKLSELRSPSRRNSIVFARGVAVYLIRELTQTSFSEIGSHLGKRDHTTIMHAYRKMEQMITTDPALRHDVQELRRILMSI